MIIDINNRRIALFLMVLFLSVRVLGLHSLSHGCDDGNDLDCSICNIAKTENNKSALNPFDQDLTIEITEFPAENKVSIQSYFVMLNAVEKNQLFSRPPPSVV